MPSAQLECVHEVIRKRNAWRASSLCHVSACPFVRPSACCINFLQIGFTATKLHLSSGHYRSILSVFVGIDRSRSGLHENVDRLPDT